MLGRSLNTIPSPPTSPQNSGSPPLVAPNVLNEPPGTETELLIGVNGWPDCAATTPVNSQLPRNVRRTFDPCEGRAQTMLRVNRCRRSNDELAFSPFLVSDTSCEKSVDVSSGSLKSNRSFPKPGPGAATLCRTSGPN